MNASPLARAASAPRSREDNPIVYLDVKIGDRAAGRLVIELRADVVPRTAENFRRLCTGETTHPLTGKRRQYAQCPFHRVVKSRFCQSGDYLNHDGSGGESTFDQPGDLLGPDNRDDDESAGSDSVSSGDAAAAATFADENFILRHAGPGVLSMVNAGPDTNASQFYLHFAANPDMDDRHVVFGSLLGRPSFQVLDAIHAVATARGDPTTPVKISGSGQLFPS
ncbi:hypothetical protein P43SY_008520 [Pythium insidiosum]|uniref:Peptidyl-prolyl cis-trans isomerase n=1 Tax=Pythium insidiosum TaxID=114742 RepID=A0AAD5LQX3_PYTIN|nr:hypothetical protein P43SY_008520 [Pythium insidiosum]